MAISPYLIRIKKILFSLLLMTATRLLPAQKIEEDSFKDAIEYFSVEKTNAIEYHPSGMSDYGFWWIWTEPLAFRAPDQILEIIRRAKANRRKDIPKHPHKELYMLLPIGNRYLKNRKAPVIPFRKRNTGPF